MDSDSERTSRITPVPLQRGHIHLLQRRDFFHGLLNVVFAKRLLPRLGRLENGFGAKGFGNGQQAHLGRVASGGLARLGDPAHHLLEVVSNRGHNVRQRTKR